MARPKCCRQVGEAPRRTCFRPEGVSPSAAKEVLLSLDEYESLRLADLEGMYQDEAASRMNISRQTFGRIVEAARRKTADAIVHGKALRIEGGQVSFASAGKAKCPRCLHALSRSDVADGNACPYCKKQV